MLSFLPTISHVNIKSQLNRSVNVKYLVNVASAPKLRFLESSTGTYLLVMEILSCLEAQAFHYTLFVCLSKFSF